MVPENHESEYAPHSLVHSSIADDAVFEVSACIVHGIAKIWTLSDDIFTISIGFNAKFFEDRWICRR